MRWSLLLFVLLFTALTIREAPAERLEGFFVYDSEGKVTLTHNRKSVPVESDTQILAGDILKTETASYLQLMLRANLSIKFTEFSHVELKNNYPSEPYIIVYNGQAMVNAKALSVGTKLSIETPTTIIQSTLPAQYFFKVYANEKGKRVTTMAVRKGTVGIFLKEGSATINILENQAIDSEENGFISHPRAATEDELKTAALANGVIISSE